jgi:hypothetical protein
MDGMALVPLDKTARAVFQIFVRDVNPRLEGQVSPKNCRSFGAGVAFARRLKIHADILLPRALQQS